jgi:hypothetical protein
VREQPELGCGVCGIVSASVYLVTGKPRTQQTRDISTSRGRLAAQWIPASSIGLRRGTAVLWWQALCRDALNFSAEVRGLGERRDLVTGRCGLPVESESSTRAGAKLAGQDKMGVLTLNRKV